MEDKDRMSTIFSTSDPIVSKTEKFEAETDSSKEAMAGKPISETVNPADVDALKELDRLLDEAEG